MRSYENYFSDFEVVNHSDKNTNTYRSTYEFLDSIQECRL